MKIRSLIINICLYRMHAFRKLCGGWFGYDIDSTILLIIFITVVWVILFKRVHVRILNIILKIK